MEPYDKTKIGKKVADGGDRKVYMYDTDKVIKFSSLSFFTGKKLRLKYNHDYLICKNYLPDYVVETIDVGNNVTGKCIEIQPFIKGEMLRKKHTTNLHAKSQLKDIMQTLDKMKKDNYPPVDLVGNMGMIKPCLSNILVDSDGNLKIIDASLLEGKTVRPLGRLLEVFLPLILARQNYLLRQFLK